VPDNYQNSILFHRGILKGKILFLCLDPNGLLILPGATSDKKETEAGIELDAMVIGPLLANF